MLDRSFVVMERLPGNTLNELTYRRPEVLDDNMVTISYQLGMHMAFSYVFGSRDGFQTNYVFDLTTKLLTRIDKESFFEVPADSLTTLDVGDPYTQEIAACELANLKYIPSFRDGTAAKKVMMAFKQGFVDKYADIKYKKMDLVQLIMDTRLAWFRMEPPADIEAYASETLRIKDTVELFIEQDPKQVFERLIQAKKEVDSGKYKKA